MQDNIGRPDRNVIQLAIMLFTLILLSNWLELIPSKHYLPAPTADLNLTLALALIVIFGVHVRGASGPRASAGTSSTTSSRCRCCSR